MQSSSEGYFNVVDLARELRSEKLFIESELESIRRLNERLEQCTMELAQASWANTQQRCNLRQIVAQGDFASSNCCPKTDFVLSPVFVDAHKVLRYQDALVLSEVIGHIRLSPAVGSYCVVMGGGLVCRVLSAGVHAGHTAPLRRVLEHLARYRLAEAPDPRRMIGMGGCGFSTLYSELVDSFHPARLFLWAALRPPLLPLLHLDEYLIVDPDKAMDRVKKYCSPNSSSPEYQQKLSRYRKWTMSSLVTATKRFILSLTEHWACFPPTVAWVVRQTAIALRESGRVSPEDIHSICTDLVFTKFICQAIMNPESYGITDIPITNIERFNLIQVAQTLQILCLLKHQEVDSKLRDLYSRFDKASVYSLLDVLLEDESYSAVPDDCSSTRDKGRIKQFGDSSGMMSERQDGDGMDLDDSIKTEPSVKANVALFTRSDLQLLVSLLKKLPSNLTNGFEHTPSEHQQNLLLERDFEQLHLQDKIDNKKSTSKDGGVVEEGGKINGGFSANGLSPDEDMNGDTACGVTPDGCESQSSDNGGMQDLNALYQDEGLCRILKTIHPEQISRLQSLLRRLPDTSFSQDPDKSKPSSSKGKHNGINGSSATSSPNKKKGSSSNSSGIGSSNGSSRNGGDSNQSQEVLVIKLQNENTYEPIGLASESKVLEWHYASMRRSTRPSAPTDLLIDGGQGSSSAAVDSQLACKVVGEDRDDRGSVGGVVVGGGTVGQPQDQHRGQEKRTRFSLSHDEGSIGNTSDNLEAASNHSVTSSLEIETEDQNDNLSDMVSANVSGRGSPNISGRDTPSSQVTEGDNPAPPAVPPPILLHHNPPLLPSNMAGGGGSKHAKLVKRVRSEIEDKFCKFEIKKLLEGDETISIISDTWSTDVLASDSETVGYDASYDRSVAAQHHNLLPGVGVVNVGAPIQPDASETASESAWSTDALVSDSDRLTEIDIDECNSVGRADVNASRSDGGTPTHHQFSPHNNIKRDALLNSCQQMSAESAHEAHPSTSGLPAVVPSTSGVIADADNDQQADCEDQPNILPAIDAASDSSSNASGGIMGPAPRMLNESGEFGDVVLRKSINGPSSSSLYTEMSSSSDSSNEVGAASHQDHVIGVVSPSSGLLAGGGGVGGAMGVGGSASVVGPRRPQAYHEHVVKAQALNGLDYDRGVQGDVNGFRHMRDNEEFPLPLPKTSRSIAPDSPGAQMSNYSLAMPHRTVLDDISDFDFALESTNRSNGLNNQVIESGISTPDGMFHSSNSPFVPPMNSNATSRWLNDPCQKFTSPRPEPTSTPTINNNKRSTSQEDIAIENSLGEMKRSNTDSLFRPIRADSNLSDIDDSGISDLNGCGVMPFLNGTDDISNQDFSSTISSDISFNNSSNGLNGFVDRFQDNQAEDFGLAFKDGDSVQPIVRMQFSSVTTQHNFTSTNMLTNTISRVLKTAENRTSILNIKSEKSNSNAKNESTSHSSSAISLNAMSMNSADSTPTSDKSSTTHENNSETVTEQRISPTLGFVSILNSTDVRVGKGPINGNAGAATLPRNATPCTSQKPNVSTGAIPKSISFDATAEKSHRHTHHGHRRFNHSQSHSSSTQPDQDMTGDGGSINFGEIKNNMKRSGGQILNKIKSLKNRSRGFAASAAGFGKRNIQMYGGEDNISKNGEVDTSETSNMVRANSDETNKPIPDMSEDILAKYRRKASSSSSEAANSDTGPQQWSANGAMRNGNRSNQQMLHTSERHADDANNASDGESAVHSELVMDAECDVLKKKLRQALSAIDTQTMELSAGRDSTVSLMCALRLAGDSYLSATLPRGECGEGGALQGLRREARARGVYLAYLARCRRELIYTIAHIESEIEWHRSECVRQSGLVASSRALVSLASREGRLVSLQERLRVGLADEKRDLLAHTLTALNAEMAREEGWVGASEWELEQASLTVERTVMSRVYLQAMFPNGDGDILRDQLLREHISRLGSLPPPLGTPPSLWLPALRPLSHLPAHKAPLDKVACVRSCLHCIVQLLSTVRETPSADHITPALVYVIIKVNPQSLLSTIQYVNTFLSAPLGGEQLYCWTQFCSAVEYIKTMDYPRATR